MKKIIVSTLCLLLFSCSFFKSEEKDFYNSIAGWDIIHVPIFPPLRATSAYPDDWLLTGNEHSLSSISLLKFGVTGQTIYGATRKGYTDQVENWFFLDYPSGLYKEYKTEKELDEILSLYELEKQQIKTCQEYFDHLSQGNRCYWYPEKGQTYTKSVLKPLK